MRSETLAALVTIAYLELRHCRSYGSRETNHDTNIDGLRRSHGCGHDCERELNRYAQRFSSSSSAIAPALFPTTW